MTEVRVEFGVLGPLQVSVAGSALALGGRKERAVLAMLVINRNRAVSADSLITAVWGEDAPPGARASLQTYVSSLRRLVGTDVLVNAAPGYKLVVADNDCDIGRFATEMAAGMQEAASGRFGPASEHLAVALGEWRGPVLEDLRDFDFVDAYATAVVEDKIAAHTARAEVEIARGRAASVIGELEVLVAEHRYREPLWAQLMTAYYLADRQSEALEAYQRLKTILVDDLGIDPGPKLRFLHEQILRQEPLDVLAAAQTTGAEAVSAMEQRTAFDFDSAYARLRSASGRSHPLLGAATRIGRLADNDIVLEDGNVSRHHAVIIDTGTSFVITDLRSANGVEVAGEKIRGTVTLADGDVIRICHDEFIFEIQPRRGDGI
jgi:SARP family transcriptional regulator, regulator of embCAB operon